MTNEATAVERVCADCDDGRQLGRMVVTSRADVREIVAENQALRTALLPFATLGRWLASAPPHDPFGPRMVRVDVPFMPDEALPPEAPGSAEFIAAARVVFGEPG